MERIIDQPPDIFKINLCVSTACSTLLFSIALLITLYYRKFAAIIYARQKRAFYVLWYCNNTIISRFINPLNSTTKPVKAQRIICFCNTFPGNKEILSSISFIPKLDYVNRIQTFTKVLSDEGKKEISLSDAKKLKFAVPILKNLDIKICN